MKKISVNKDFISKLAKLANLPLSEKEIGLYQKQIKNILDYIKLLQKLETKKTKPTYQVIDNLSNVYRKDESKPSLSQKQALSNAKVTHEGYFLVDHVFSKKNKSAKPVSHKQRKKLDKHQAILTQGDSQGKVGHKDLFTTKNIETTAGSYVLQDYIPQYSATIVKQFEENSFKTKFKLNQDAWGHGSSGENSDFFPTKNPWNLDYVPGGSSSGSAAAVASGLVEVATGTDTGSSIRLPAAFTNTTGLKTTYGNFSRWGVIAFASSLDCPGLITRSVKDLKKYYQFLAKQDKLDANTCGLRKKQSKKPIKSLGLPKQYFDKAVDPQIKKLVTQAAKLLEKQGVKLKPVSLPHTQYGVAAYYIIAPVETSSNLSRFDGIRYGNSRENFGAEAKRRIILGTFTSTAGYADKYYEQAARVRTLIVNDFEQAFNHVDALLAPVCPTPAFKIGEKANDPLKMYLSDALTIPVNLSGIPALSIPCGFTKENLPVGMQLIGPRWSEPQLFDLGEKYQSLTDWHKQKPPAI